MHSPPHPFQMNATDHQGRHPSTSGTASQPSPSTSPNPRNSMLLARGRHRGQQKRQQRPESFVPSQRPSSQSSSLVIKGNDGLPLQLNDLALPVPLPASDPSPLPPNTAEASPSLTADSRHLLSLPADPTLRRRRSSLTACFPRLIRALAPCIPHSHSQSDSRHHASHRKSLDGSASASDSSSKFTGSVARPVVLFPAAGNHGHAPISLPADLNPKPTSYMSRTIEPSFTTHDSSHFGHDESAYATTLSLTSAQPQLPRPVHRQGSRSSQMARVVPVPITDEAASGEMEAEDGKWVRRISTALPRPPIGSPPVPAAPTSTAAASACLHDATEEANNQTTPAPSVTDSSMPMALLPPQPLHHPLERTHSHRSRPPTPTASPALTSNPNLEPTSTPISAPLQHRASVHGSTALSRSASVDVRRQREPRYERVWPDQVNDISALADMMRSLWNGYTTTVLLRHPEVSRHALVVALYSTLVTQNTARGDSLQRCNSVAQLHAMLRHSQIPTELLVPPPKIAVSSSTSSPSSPSQASTALPRSESSSSLTAVLLSNQPTGGASAEDLHLLHSAQWLVTHHIASACYALFAKLENLHCVPMLRSLLARQRDDIPLFLATCPKEVTAVYTHLSASAIPPPLPSQHTQRAIALDRSESSASVHSTASASSKRRPWDFMDDLPTAATPSPPFSRSPSSPASNPLPAWFANPSTTALERLGALLQREMATTCTLLIRVLYSAGLSIPSAQHLYNMVIRSVRLFAYMMAAQPKLRWTWTPCDRPAKSDTMRVVNRAALSDAFDLSAGGIGSLTRGVRLSVLFSVSPGLVLDDPHHGKEAVPQLVVPELVFAVPASRLHLRMADPMRPLSVFAPSPSDWPIGSRQTESVGQESRGSWMSMPALALSRRASTGDAFVPPPRVHSAAGGLGKAVSVTVSTHVQRHQLQSVRVGRLTESPSALWSPLTGSASPQSSMMQPIVSPLKEEYEPDERLADVDGHSHFESATPMRTPSPYSRIRPLPTPPPHSHPASRPSSIHTRTSGSTSTSGRPRSHHRAYHTPSPLSSSRRSSSGALVRPSSILLLEAVTQAADAALHHAPDAAGTSADLVHLWLSATEAALVHDEHQEALQVQAAGESLVDSGLMIAGQQGGARATFLLHDDDENPQQSQERSAGDGNNDSATTILISSSPAPPMPVDQSTKSSALATPILYAPTPEVVATVVLHAGGPRASVLSSSSGSPSIGAFLTEVTNEGPQEGARVGGMSCIPPLAALRSGSTSPTIRF